jgi:hypothetical protein
MKLTYIVLFAALLACQTKKQNTESTIESNLTYKIENVAAVSKICKSDTADCGKATYHYPLFSGENSDKFNALVASELIGIFVDQADTKDTIKTIQQVAAKFIGEYEIAKKAHPEEFPWTQEADVKVINQNKILLQTHTNTGWYTGGAHPMSMEFYSNYDVDRQKKLSLDDIFAPNYDQALLKIAEEIFRTDEKLKPTDMLDESNGYFFEKGKFILTDNFLITKTGLEFVYNVYEIKPYAAGITTLKIPKEKLTPLIKKDYFNQ